MEMKRPVLYKPNKNGMHHLSYSLMHFLTQKNYFFLIQGCKTPFTEN